MIHAIGLDIVDVNRISNDIKRYDHKFLRRILSPAELELLEHRKDCEMFVAGRFAAKEAIIKAIGFRITEKPALSSLDIVNDPTGRPEVRFPDDISEKLGKIICLLSITHERSHAAAVAILTEEI